LIAPGNKIFSVRDPNSTLDKLLPGSVVPLSLYEKGSDPGEASAYFSLNGTSMAAGVVSGAVAALLDAGDNDDFTPDQVKARLMKTASKNFPRTTTIVDSTLSPVETFTIHYDIFTVGAGYLDLDAAIASHDTIPANKNAASPIAVVTGTTSDGHAI